MFYLSFNYLSNFVGQKYYAYTQNTQIAQRRKSYDQKKNIKNSHYFQSKRYCRGIFMWSRGFLGEIYTRQSVLFWVKVCQKPWANPKDLEIAKVISMTSTVV